MSEEFIDTEAEAELEALAEGRASSAQAWSHQHNSSSNSSSNNSGSSSNGSSDNSSNDSSSSSVYLRPFITADEIRHLDDEGYISLALSKLDEHHELAFAPPSPRSGRSGLQKRRETDVLPAERAHPSVRVHGVHGLDPSTTSRSEIEAKLEAIDAARKADKRAKERDAAAAALQQMQIAPASSSATAATNALTPSPLHTQLPADEAILKLLALKKLQLLQQHLRTDNLPVLVLAATETHGNLYLGSVGASHHLPNLLQHGITHILSVGRNLTQPFPNHFQYLYIPMLDSSSTKITHDVFESSWQFVDEGRRSGRGGGGGKEKEPQQRALAANGTQSQHQPQSLSSLRQSEREEGLIHSSARNGSSSHTPPGNVFVHCFAGKSRSTTILISYLMYHCRWSLEQAFNHVKKCRPSIAPNPGFILQLRELEKKLRADEAAAAKAAAANAAAAAAAVSANAASAAPPAIKATASHSTIANGASATTAHTAPASHSATHSSPSSSARAASSHVSNGHVSASSSNGSRVVAGHKPLTKAAAPKTVAVGSRPLATTTRTK